jgi:hypothetical protein
MSEFTTRIAEDAVEESISHNSIVHIDGDQDVYDDLLSECDDFCDRNDGETEFWGADWRVHLKLVTMI